MLSAAAVSMSANLLPNVIMRDRFLGRAFRDVQGSGRMLGLEKCAPKKKREKFRRCGVNPSHVEDGREAFQKLKDKSFLPPPRR